MKTLIAKKLIVTIQETEDCDTLSSNSRVFQIECWEFPNKLLLMYDGYDANCFVLNKDKISLDSHQKIQCIEETSETFSYTALLFAEVLKDATLSYGYDDSIKKGWELIKTSR
jgi:hypothetical protein